MTGKRCLRRTERRCCFTPTPGERPKELLQTQRLCRRGAWEPQKGETALEDETQQRDYPCQECLKLDLKFEENCNTLRGGARPVSLECLRQLRLKPGEGKAVSGAPLRGGVLLVC